MSRDNLRVMTFNLLSGRSYKVYRGMGSIDITAASRSVLLCGPTPDGSGQCAIVHTKCNNARKAPTVGFELLENDPEEIPIIQWVGELPYTAQDVLRANVVPVGRPENEVLEAMAFLRQNLAEGPMRKSKIERAANDKKIKPMTLRRARERLGLVVTKDGRHSVWSLPDIAA